MYSLHDIEVIGLDLAEILECEIESHIGSHGRSVIAARVSREELVYEIPDCQSFEVILHVGEENKILFSGILTGIEISEDGQMKIARIEGKSRSWLMDRERRSRSFQNAKMTYKELIKEVLGGYEGTDLHYAAPEKKIGSLIVQYEETDWEFMQRVLSQIGAVLTPDCCQSGLKLYAGVPQLLDAGCPFRIIDMQKDMAGYYELKANGKQVQDSDFTRYVVSSEHVFRIFNTLTVSGSPLTVSSCKYFFLNQTLQGIYEIQSAGGLGRTPVYPMHLIGVALNGKVVGVSGSKVQVGMRIDGRHTKRAQHWFPYSTISASADGSGWYCMPEIGDDVMIYFPSKQESEAIALSSVSSYNAPRSGKDRMSDPNSRYLRTKSGQELALAPGYIKLSSAGEVSALTIQEDGKVEIQSQAFVKAMAEDEIVIRAREDIKIHVSESFLIQSLNGGQIISQDGNVVLRGTEVKFD